MHVPHPPGGPDIGSAAEWFGAAAEWVSAIATVLALCGAAVTIWFAARAVRTSREANSITLAAYQADVRERRERQARFVYALNEIPLMHSAGAVIRWQSQYGNGTAEAGVYIDGSFQSLNGGISQQTVAADMLSTVVTVHNRSEEIVASWIVSLYDRFTGEPVGGIGIGEEASPLLPGDSATVHIEVLQPTGFNPHIGPVLEFRDSSGQRWRRRGSDPIELLSGGA